MKGHQKYTSLWTRLTIRQFSSKCSSFIFCGKHWIV